jgi:transposase-like protein
MRKARFTESQITQALKEHEVGNNVLDICRELQINRNTFYNWTKKYSFMDSALLRR